MEDEFNELRVMADNIARWQREREQYPNRPERWHRSRDEELDIEADAAEYGGAPELCCPWCGGGLRVVKG